MWSLVDTNISAGDLMSGFSPRVLLKVRFSKRQSIVLGTSVCASFILFSPARLFLLLLNQVLAFMPYVCREPCKSSGTNQEWVAGGDRREKVALSRRIQSVGGELFEVRESGVLRRNTELESAEVIETIILRWSVKVWVAMAARWTWWVERGKRRGFLLIIE